MTSLKRCFALVMVMLMILSLVHTPVFAATVEPAQNIVDMYEIKQTETNLESTELDTIEKLEIDLDSAVEGCEVSITCPIPGKLATYTDYWSYYYQNMSGSADVMTSITVNNHSQGQILRFYYKASDFGSIKVSDNEIATEAWYEVAAGESVTMTVVVPQKKLPTMNFNSFSLITATQGNTKFVFDDSLGELKVNGEKITSGSFQELGSTAVSVTAIPKENVEFLGWINGETGEILSEDAGYAMKGQENLNQVKAAFAFAESKAWFRTNTYNKQYLFDDLNSAVAFADKQTNSNYKKITLASSGILVQGNYTIPSGVRLLIPHSANDKGTFDKTPGRSSETPGTSQKSFRTLNMKSGALLNVTGQLNVNGRVYDQNGTKTTFCTDTYGHINIEENAQINLNKDTNGNGGTLYCYGYITGDGKVTANNGSNVYEVFQLTGWTGGSHAYGWNKYKKQLHSFPFVDYAVQNIEAKFLVCSGATANVVATLTVDGILGDTTQDKDTIFIGSQSGLIQLGENGSVYRCFDKETYRMQYEFAGNVSIANISIDMDLGLLGDISLNSASYILAIPYNMDFVATSGTVVLANSYKIMPGATLTVGPNANAIVQGKLYIYDTVDARAMGAKSVPVGYVATTDESSGFPKMNSKTPSGKVVVNGTLTIAENGAIYTTENGGKTMDKIVTGTGVIYNNSIANSVDNYLDEITYTGSRFDTVATSNPVVSYPMVGQIAGASAVNEYHNFAQGTYYGLGNGYWYQHIVSTSAFENINSFKNIPSAATAAVNRNRVVTQQDKEVSNVLGFVSKYLNITETGSEEVTTPFSFTVNSLVEVTADENSTLAGTGTAKDPYIVTMVKENTILTSSVPQDSDSTIYMRYDDRREFGESVVEIINAGEPTSYQVGYGINENEVRDTAVVTLTEGNVLIATGTGTATISVDGVEKTVIVSAAPISMLFLGGQSNMQGSRGNGNQSIACEDGMVYATYGDRYGMAVSNATTYAPSSLAGNSNTINVVGTTAGLKDYPVNMLTAGIPTKDGYGKSGPDSAYAYQWVESIGEKVWVINAAHGGSPISSWQKSSSIKGDKNDNYHEAVKLFKACQETMRKEIAAGHYTLSHMGFYWCQGESDSTNTAEYYVNNFLAMYNDLKTDLSADMDSDPETPDQTIEFTNIVLTFAGHLTSTGYRFEDGLYVSGDNKGWYTVEELEMRGQRVAQLWLAANASYPDINVVCNIADSWMTMEDGNDGVAEYFQEHYENGVVDYTTQVKQSSSWYKPTKASDVRCTATDSTAARLHYNQLGYNEIGREAVRNTMYLLGYAKDPDVETTVTFYDWTGYREATSINAVTDAQSSTLIVPVVSPIYRTKDVTYSVSDGLTYKYYDLTAEATTTSGTLTAYGAKGNSVQVNSRALGEYRWEFDDGKFVSCGPIENEAYYVSGQISDGVFDNMQARFDDPIALKHNENWLVEIRMVNTWEKAVTKILANNGGARLAGDVSLAATSTGVCFSYVYENNGSHTNKGVSSLMSEGDSTPHTFRIYNIYDETTKNNQIYVTIDGGNPVAMDSYVNRQDYVFGYIGNTEYPLNKGYIEYIHVMETGATVNTHIHQWSEWVQTVEPTFEIVGEETRECACGEIETREVPCLQLPTVYYWELKNDELVSSNKHGATENILTNKVGTITNGVTNTLQYKISTPIVLGADKEWAVEWLMSGVTSKWQKILVSEAEALTAGDIGIMLIGATPDKSNIAFGHVKSSTHYNYYANELVPAGIDLTKEHKYRLQNELNEDGSNMIYLYIDDTLIGAMDYDAKAGTDGSNWAERNLTFNYIGQRSNYTLTGAVISYIKVQLDDAVSGDINPEHIWNEEPEWIWTGDVESGYTATAKFTCDCGDVKTILATVESTITDATTETAGKAEYIASATFNGKDYTGSKSVEIPKLEVTYTKYRWELKNDALVSVTTDGYTENILQDTKTGSIVNGVTKNAQYKITTPVVLESTKDWAVEWYMSGSTSSWQKILATKASLATGDYAIMMIGNSLAIGNYKTVSGKTTHYNHATNELSTSGLDLSQAHKYRLQNEFAEDGSNMIYLYIDNNLIGAMDYDSTNKKDDTAWTQNLTMTFNYIGQTSYPLSGAAISYIEVQLEGASLDEETPGDGETPDEPENVFVNELYRWDVKNDSFDSTGAIVNNLRVVKGGINDGLFSSAQYALNKPIILSADKDWIVEWQMINNIQSGGKYQKLMTLSEGRKNGDIAVMVSDSKVVLGYDYNGHTQYTANEFAESGIDMTTEHIYRLENRINEDGTNMVYLFVDNVEIGAMDYQVSTGTTNSFIKGKDIVLGYFGQADYPINDISLSYIRVQESSEGHVHKHNAVVTKPTCTEGGYTTHRCIACEDTYVDGEKESLGHTYGEPTYTWDSDEKPETCTATFICVACDDEQNVTDNALDVVTTPATTANSGQTVYTAKVTFNGKEYTGTKTVEIPKLTGITVSFVNYTADEDSVRATVNVDGEAIKYQNGISTSAILDENRKFIVECLNACVVAYTLNGEDYTIIPAKAIDGANNNYLFELPEGVDSEVQIIVMVKGDANCDGYFNSTDITALRKTMLDSNNKLYRKLSAVENVAADANSDGYVNSTDVTEMRKALLTDDNKLYSSIKW